MKTVTIIFFDLGDTLGTAIVQNGKLTGFTPFDFAIPVLKDLAARKFRLGVISNTGDETRTRMEEVLKAAGLLEFFEPGLLIFSSEAQLTKDSPAIFELAAKKAEENPTDCLFVGENAQERAFAVEAGFSASADARDL